MIWQNRTEQLSILCHGGSKCPFFNIAMFATAILQKYRKKGDAAMQRMMLPSYNDVWHVQQTDYLIENSVVFSVVHCPFKYWFFASSHIEEKCTLAWLLNEVLCFKVLSMKILSAVICRIVHDYQLCKGVVAVSEVFLWFA